MVRLLTCWSSLASGPDYSLVRHEGTRVARERGNSDEDRAGRLPSTTSSRPLAPAQRPPVTSRDGATPGYYTFWLSVLSRIWWDATVHRPGPGKLADHESHSESDHRRRLPGRTLPAQRDRTNSRRAPAGGSCDL